ncbi:hypothetical protein GMORB2_0154 [Geosmithia morbida]|uniref:PPM-type phosphatase domain-containing protein n=1 Tax=Geosmithia morbida TaxID=1094350 RepID=A0A9P4Z384_9HYPO|nr:uncharacterized protein GMORB2_0154 [Geosmithia morbida]KAF4126418.1 hypothetical protein GMORB2_0154 [Geosmithia morbida]
MYRATPRTLQTTHSIIRNTISRSSHAHSHSRSRSLSFFAHPTPHASSSLRSSSAPSSMYLRRLPAAVAGSLAVGYGAWYLGAGGAINPLAYLTPSTRSYSVPPTGGATGASSSALPTRTVLVVGADELRQGTVVGEGPISKVVGGAGDDANRKIVEMLTPEQATQKLRKLEQSYLVSRGEGVIRYDLVQLPSNDPIEDDHAEKIVQVPGRSAGNADNDWMFWGVFDGHSYVPSSHSLLRSALLPCFFPTLHFTPLPAVGSIYTNSLFIDSGWTTSATLRENLINYVATELNETHKAAAKDGAPTPDAIDLAIKTGFGRLDDEIVHKSVEKVIKSSSKNVAAELLQPALSGSCALLSFYDCRTNLLRVACTGDSRAVLGRRSKSGSGKWTASPLSDDQTGSNPREADRMRREHPGEEAHVVRNGRVLGGLEPTRAFGDAVYKWSRATANQLREKFFGRTPSPLLKTPPYVTAEPVITTTKVNPQDGDFLVLATDGLWEMLTNEEVVGLVGQWIDSQKAASGSSSGSTLESAWSKFFGSAQKPLPVEDRDAAAASGASGSNGQKTPIRLQQWGIDPNAKDRFVVKDKNVATHLVRNALGGTNDEQVSALLTLPAPFSRRYRDDLTVQVIFFGNGAKTGDVVLNPEASADQTPKAKL